MCEGKGTQGVRVVQKDKHEALDNFLQQVHCVCQM